MTPGHSRYADRLGEFGDLIAAGGTRAGGWTNWFAGRLGPRFDGRVYCEVGCGDGDLLCAAAGEHPTAAFVGVDWAFKAVHAAADRAGRAGLANVGLVRGRGQDVARWFGPSELAGLWVFHPDPVDRDGRLIGEPFLLSVHPLLGPGGTIAIKTDHPGYYQWVGAILGRPSPGWFVDDDASRVGPAPRVRRRDVEPPASLPPFSPEVARRFAVTADVADYWHDPRAAAAARGQPYADLATPFERRYRAKRLPIYYVELTAVANPATKGGVGT